MAKSSPNLRFCLAKFSQIFDPYPPTVGNFLVLSVGKFGKFLTPPPLGHADVLNGWSPLEIHLINLRGLKTQKFVQKIEKCFKLKKFAPTFK